MSTSVDVLLPGFGSVTPGGGVTVAVLIRLPVALVETLARRMYVATAPARNETVVLIGPNPDVAPQAFVPEPLPCAVIRQVQLTLVSATGVLSTTLAFVTAAGPLLVTVIE